MPGNRERDFETLDYQETDERNQQLGAKILSGVHFESSHQPIVKSSFNKAKEKGEKLPGNNSERRNYAYLSRLEKLINENGNEVEKRLWQESINDDMLIKYENIPESYWEAKKQELRDNGYGSVELTESLKHEYFKKERELQRESLEKWVNYLGDVRSPYPLWFKVYAWDGMTKMGGYNKGKGEYESRNETTIAPYPNPDAEVLVGVFDVVNRYYGNSEKEFYTEEGERNIKLEQIVRSGSFPKIFNAVQQDIAPILESPEKAEDVQGEWIEYELGDEDDIARAARGTGWCIASSSVGKHYLKYGTYGEAYDNYDNDNDYGSNLRNQSKFILLHLISVKTGKLSKNACASIRLDPDGNVAEISGLRDGQALDDSLVPIVEEKVKSLPGGEKFLEAFADKNILIALDRKMQKGEDLTKEELEFIYEIKRPIRTLDTYNNYDPRITELKQRYDVEYALNNRVNFNQLVSKICSCDIVNNLDTLISHGATINQLVSKMSDEDIVKNLDTLISHGATIDVNQLVSTMGSYDIVNNLDTLISHGATIDVNQLVSTMNPIYIVKNLDTLISHGATIDVNQLVSTMDSYDIVNNLDTLISHGATIDVNQLVSTMGPFDIVANLDTLISHGATIDVDQLVSRMDPDDIVTNLDALISHCSNISQLVDEMYSYDILSNLDTLISHGATINQLVSRMYEEEIVANLDTLISHGATIDINQLVSRMYPSTIAAELDTLISHGATIDVNQLVSRMDPSDIATYKDTLIKYGASIDQTKH